jgi:hypothetical protein
MATPLPLSPFITEPDRRFVLDVNAFMAAIERPQLFQRNAYSNFNSAVDLEPIARVLSRF